MRGLRYLYHASHKGRFSKYRSFVQHYLSRILRKNSNKDKVFFFLLDENEQQKHFKRILDSYNKGKRHPIMNRNYNTENEPGVSSFIMGKIMGAYKTTKESPYVKSLYQEAEAAFNYRGSSRGAEEPTPLPPNTHITLYPNYCRHENGEYVTRIKGAVTTVGIMSRKNRFLLGMARRLTKSNDNVDSSQIENELHDAITNQDSYKARDDDSLSTSSTNTAMPDDTVKSRMEGILAKTIPNTPLNITVGAGQPVDKLVGASLTTDSFGIFQVSLVTPYRPSYVAVSSILDSSILQTTTVEIIEPKGVSVITDIDDTIRLTGVLGDKRELFRNIFLKPYASCEIPGVSEWYQELHNTYQCPVHYVSNSPWQIFNVVYGFMDYLNFPVTSIHLRQYSGNLVASFTQPSAERKRPSLVSLLEEFPDRKFILIGDTGEQDLEAYMSLLPRYAPQILAIYMRVVANSLSSLGDDEKVLKYINNILSKRNSAEITAKNTNNSVCQPSGVTLNKANDDYCDTRHVSSSPILNETNANSDGKIVGVKKLAPIVPRKPASLKGQKIRLSEHNDKSESVVVEKNLDYDDHIAYYDSSDSDGGVGNPGENGHGMEPIDKRFELWKQRMDKLVNEVPEHISVKFWETSKDVKDDSIERVINELK